MSDEPVGSTDYAAMLDGVMERIIKESQPTSYGVGMARGAAAERARIEALIEARAVNWTSVQARDALLSALAAVRSASPAGADRQPVDRERCDDCDLYYAIWYADSDLWNAVIPDRVGMLCPRCFLIRAEPVTEVARVTWPDPPSRRDRERGADWPGSKSTREDTSD